MELDLDMIQDDFIEVNEPDNSYDEFETTNRQYHLYMNRGSRREMLDRVRISTNLKFSTGGGHYGIYDGHGSAMISEYLSKHLPEHLSPSMNSLEYIKVFQEIDQQFAKYHDEGSVALLLSIQNSAVTVTSLGDSKALVIRDHSCQQISVSHLPNLHSEKQRIEKLGGWVMVKNKIARVQGRLNVSRSFGDFALKKYISCQPEITHYELSQADKYIVMASDGLWNELSDEQITDYLNNAKNKNNLAKGLFDLIKEQTDYIKDNITIFVIPL